MVTPTAAGEGELAPAPVPPGPPRRGLALSSTFVFATAVIIQVIGFVGSFALAHTIGVTPQKIGFLGIAFLYLTIASSINGIADLRLGLAYTYYVARGTPPEQATGTYALLRLTMVLAVGVTLGLLAPLPGIRLVTDPTEQGLFWVYMLLPLLWTPQFVYNSLWVARGDAVRAQFPSLIESVGRTTGILVVALTLPGFLGSAFGITPAGPTLAPEIRNEVLLALTAVYVAAAGAATLFALPSVLRFAGRFLRSEARRFFVFAWPLMGAMFLQFLAGNSIPFVVAGVIGATGFAVFLAGNGFRILLLAVPNAVNVPLFPNLTGLHARGESAEVRRRAWAALRYTALLVIPGAVALAVYRFNFLYVFFNAHYAQEGQTPLAILVISALPAALTQVIQTALNAVGLQRLELYLTSVQVVGLFAAAAILMPLPFGLAGFAIGGLNGAALAVLVSALGAFALNAYFLRTRLRVEFDARPILSITVAAIVTFVAVAQLNRFVNPNHWNTLFGLVVFGFVVYALFLAAIGEVTKRDVTVLAGSLGLPPALVRALARLCWREGAR